jgi:hypothetical protein
MSYGHHEDVLAGNIWSLIFDVHISTNHSTSMAFLTVSHVSILVYAFLLFSFISAHEEASGLAKLPTKPCRQTTRRSSGSEATEQEARRLNMSADDRWRQMSLAKSSQPEQSFGGAADAVVWPCYLEDRAFFCAEWWLLLSSICDA